MVVFTLPTRHGMTQVYSCLAHGRVLSMHYSPAAVACLTYERAFFSKTDQSQVDRHVYDCTGIPDGGI